MSIDFGVKWNGPAVASFHFDFQIEAPGSDPSQYSPSSSNISVATGEIVAPTPIAIHEDSLEEASFELTFKITHFNGQPIEPPKTYTVTVNDNDGAASGGGGQGGGGQGGGGGSIALSFAHAAAWEGDYMRLFVGATSSASPVMGYSFDFDYDGNFADGWAGHNVTIGGALIEEVPWNIDHLGTGGVWGMESPQVDDGTYTAAVRVQTYDGTTADFDFPVRVGNVPPMLTIDPAYFQSGSAASLPITIEEPNAWGTVGPLRDTVSSISVAWGDGETTTFPGSASEITHTYAESGIYSLVVTVTDDDGNWTFPWQLNVGDTDTPLAPLTGPQIIEGYAEFIAGDTAVITATVESPEGYPIVSYEWDLDGDGTYETTGSGASAVVTKAASALAWAPALRVIDAAGNAAEAIFPFLQAGPVQAGPATANQGKALFRRLTPAVPADWAIHHTKQDALAGRYLTELGINVQDPQYLRAVPREVHDIIGGEQTRWWAKKGKELGITSTQAKQVVPLAEVQAFEAKLDAEWHTYWVTKGAQSRDVTQVTNRLKKAGGKFGLVADEANRLKRLGILTAEVLPFFALVAGWAKPAHAAAILDPAHDAELDVVRDRYATCIDDALTPPLYRVSKTNAQLLAEAVRDFVNKFDDEAATEIRAAMGAYIDLHLP